MTILNTGKNIHCWLSRHRPCDARVWRSYLFCWSWAGSRLMPGVMDNRPHLFHNMPLPPRLLHRTKFYCLVTEELLQPFNGLFSRTTWVSRYQIGKTNLDFTGARDSEWQWHQLQTDNHASTPPLCFLQARCPSCRPTNRQRNIGVNNAQSRYGAAHDRR